VSSTSLNEDSDSDSPTLTQRNDCRLHASTFDKIGRTRFSDEKVFIAKTLTNTQNDHVYARGLKKRDVTTERLLKGRIYCY